MPDERPAVAIAMPVHNEEAALRAFLPELDRAFGPRASSITVCIVDDVSTDASATTAEDVASRLALQVEVHRRASNGGHGPATRDAYELALATGAPVIAQLDGDGQFPADDVRAVLDALTATAADDPGAAEVSTGVRVRPVGPWYRRLLSRSLRAGLALVGVRSRDPNIPLRAYRAGTLRRLLADVPSDPLVPNVLLTIFARHLDAVVVEVRHRPRIGGDVGTMWAPGTAARIVGLARFSARALIEVVVVVGRSRRAKGRGAEAVDRVS